MMIPSARAQTIPSPHSFVDSNGVDLVTGGLIFQGTSVVIGDPAAGGLTRALTGITPFGAQTDNFTMSLTVSGSTYTVTLGAHTDVFTLTGGNFVPAYPGGTAFASSGGVYNYATRDSTVLTFGPTASVVNGGVSNNIYLVTQLKKATGETQTFNYVSLTPVAGYVMQRLQSVTNNFGYMIKYSYQADTGSVAAAMNLTQVMGINNAINYCNPTADTCAGLTVPWPVVNFAIAGPVVNATDAMGNVTKYTPYAAGPNPNGLITNVTMPSGNSKTITYATGAMPKVATVQYNSSGHPWVYAYNSPTSGTNTVTDPLGHVRTITASGSMDRQLTDKDALGNTTTYTWNTSGQLTGITYPEGNSVSYQVDGMDNVTQTTQIAKPGSGLANIVTYATYTLPFGPPPPPFAPPCWNRLSTSKDALGNVTTYTYDPTYCVLTGIQYPTPTGGPTPQVTLTYNAYSAYYLNSAGALVAGSPIRLLASKWACAFTPVSACPGAADQALTTYTYGVPATANNLLPTVVAKAAGDGSVSTQLTYAYDALGNLTTSQTPIAGQVTAYFYDADRHRIGEVGPDPDGAGPLPNRALSYGYNSDGLLFGTYYGTTAGQSAANFAAFAPAWGTAETYTMPTDQTIPGLKMVEGFGGAASGGANVYYAYDLVGRMTCANTRMVWNGAAPTSACALGTAGADGPDRITHYTYDNADRLTQVTSGYASSDPRNDQTFTYGANGEVLTVADAKGNLTTYGYDGFVRRTTTYYPNPMGSGSSTTDYEQLTYDANSRVVQDRRRDGTTVTLAYDQLNRLTRGPRGETFAYDGLNQMVHAVYAGLPSDFQYDALGEKVSEGEATYQYDKAGQMTRITWWDGFYVAYVRDLTEEITKIEENGATSGPGLLGTFTYDNIGRKTKVTRGNGVNTTFTYDGGTPSLTGYTHAYPTPNTASSLTVGLTHGPNGQIDTRTWSNPSYNWAGGYTVSRAYTVDGQNKLLTSGSLSLTYGDARGNITSDGVNSYGYDIQNNLTSMGGATLSYDALGRLAKTVGAATTQFGYSGSQVIVERDGGGNLLRRYVPMADVWYEGVFTADRRWMLADERGSVIAVTNGSGAALAINTYDAYGIPGASNLGRLQYTGQMWIPEIGMYHYKSRAYSPTLGRFMQTDPSGFAGGMNIYAYVGNNPVNATDPTGLDGCSLICDPGTDVGEVVVTGVRLPSLSTSGAGIGVPQITITIPLLNISASDVMLDSDYLVTVTARIVKVAKIVVPVLEAAPAVALGVVFNGIPSHTASDDTCNGQCSLAKPRPPSLPWRGPPGSTVIGNGQGRRYGPDGYPEVDVDTGHDHNGAGDPHAHDIGRPDGGGPPTHEDRGDARPVEPGDPIPSRE